VTAPRPRSCTTSSTLAVRKKYVDACVDASAPTSVYVRLLATCPLFQKRGSAIDRECIYAWAGLHDEAMDTAMDEARRRLGNKRPQRGQRRKTEKEGYKNAIERTGTFRREVRTREGC
jgi:hypothetical protein